MPPLMKEAVERTGFRGAGEIDAVVAPEFDGIERGDVAFEVEEFRSRDPEMPQAAVGEVGELREDAMETLRFGVRKGTEEDGVDDAENGGGGADAQGQAEHGNRGEAGVLSEHAKAVANVLQERRHETSLRFEWGLDAG